MAHDDPYRLRILKGLTRSLEQISISDGYKYDLAGHVWRGRSVFGPNDVVPLVSILEPPLPIDSIKQHEDDATTQGEWDLIVQGFMDDDASHPTDPAHYLMADVKKRLAVERKTNFGGRHKGIAPKYNLFDLGMGTALSIVRVGAGVVRPADEVSSKAYFWLTLTLKIAEDDDDPYA